MEQCQPHTAGRRGQHKVAVRCVPLVTDVPGFTPAPRCLTPPRRRTRPGPSEPACAVRSGCAGRGRSGATRPAPNRRAAPNCSGANSPGYSPCKCDCSRRAAGCYGTATRHCSVASTPYRSEVLSPLRKERLHTAISSASHRRDLIGTDHRYMGSVNNLQRNTRRNEYLNRGHYLATVTN